MNNKTNQLFRTQPHIQKKTTAQWYKLLQGNNANSKSRFPQFTTINKNHNSKSAINKNSYSNHYTKITH